MSTDEPFTMRGGERRVTTILLEFPQLPCDDGGDPLQDALLVRSEELLEAPHRQQNVPHPGLAQTSRG